MKKTLCTAAAKASLYYLLLAPVIAMPFYNTLIFHPFEIGDFEVKSLAGVPCRNEYFSRTNYAIQSMIILRTQSGLTSAA